jgi:hypothetical protein
MHFTSFPYKKRYFSPHRFAAPCESPPPAKDNVLSDGRRGELKGILVVEAEEEGSLLAGKGPAGG